MTGDREQPDDADSPDSDCGDDLNNTMHGRNGRPTEP
jgi:hypothetical protein